jgi:hypothetical protein
MPTANISRRDYIRRGTAPASEPTSTLVLTSRSGWYIDVRILLHEPRPKTSQLEKLKSVFKDANADDAEFFEEAKKGPLTAKRLDWAFSGQGWSTPAKGKEPGISKWEHWVDSTIPWNEPAEDDKGFMYPQDDGRTLEKGSSINPVTGKKTTYEEMWRDVLIRRPSSWPDTNWQCIILVCEEPKEKTRGCIMRLGPYCQGVKRIGEDFCAERWKYAYSDEWVGGKWCLLARVGDHKIGCEALFSSTDDEKELGERFQVGRTLTIGEIGWTVTEVAKTW